MEKTNKNLEEFAYVATHDLRSPITNLKSLTELLTPEISEASKPIYEKLKESIDRINVTLNDLIIVSAHQKTLDETYVSINLKDKIEALKSGLFDIIKKSKATVSYDFKEVEDVFFPRGHIRSILQNLLTNSLKYKSDSRDPKIHISSKKEDGSIILTVSDNGPGIPEDKLEYIFGLFKRLDSNQEGKGMGLYIVKSLVDALGGRIEVQSTLGKGTNFKILLKDRQA